MKSLQARLAALSAAHGIPPVGSETPATAATAAAAGGTPMACGTRGGAAASEAAHASGGGGGHQLTMSLQGGLRRFGFKSKALRVTKSVTAATGPESSVREKEEVGGLSPRGPAQFLEHLPAFVTREVELVGPVEMEKLAGSRARDDELFASEQGEIATVQLG